MPYKQIVFVKIKMKLFEDDRFLFDLNDRQKGLFLMLIGLAGKTENKIRNEVEFIKSRLNLKHIEYSDLEHISKVYDKFSLKDNYWQFDDFDEVHNWFGNSQGTPKELPRSSKKENKKEIKNKNKYMRFAPPQIDVVSKYFIEELKTDPLTPKNFFDYYESKGWVVGRAPMKNWQAAASGWVRNSHAFKPGSSDPKKDPKFSKLFRQT